MVDANFNRAKEGLRVVEDIFRFCLADNNLRKKIRKVRHALDSVVQEKVLKRAILSRDSRQDLGRKVDYLEFKRKDTVDTLYINFQRVKESLRVLEEFFKLILPGQVAKIKKVRYEIYTIEKASFRTRSSLRSPRPKNG